MRRQMALFVLKARVDLELHGAVESVCTGETQKDTCVYTHRMESKSKSPSEMSS